MFHIDILEAFHAYDPVLDRFSRKRHLSLLKMLMIKAEESN